MTTDQRGVALLEVLAAFTLLAIAGLTLTAVLHDAASAAIRAEAAERDMRDANRILTATTLLRREDLVRRIGVHRIGNLTVAVTRPRPAIYRIAVSDTGWSGEELLVTLVHRREPGQ